MLLEIDNLVKQYKKGPKANDGISVSVDSGEIFGLLGPNGAGKTTLINQIIGLQIPDSGSIKINGINVVANPDYARQTCSFQAQTQVPIAGLTALQAIQLIGQIRGGEKGKVRKKAVDLIEKLEITEWTNKMGANLSGGVRRIVAFCMAAVVPGHVVILDEPTNDIDPVRRRLLWNEIRKLAESGSAVLLVTHNVLEAERVVNRLAVIDKGWIIGMGTAAELKGDENNIMRLEITLEPEAVVSSIPWQISHAVTSNRRLIAHVNEENVSEVIEWAKTLRENGIAEEYLIGPTTLEDAYIRMVGRLDTMETSQVNDDA
ncbi:MAG: ABC transporter ATP-binding protein [Dehalococcoidales bacterium]|nr:ABC transporter ATP-binding protein [Dehalococcoidales bacterium]